MVCANSPVFEVENNIGRLMCYCTQEPIKADGTRICHVKQWPTPPSMPLPNNVSTSCVVSKCVVKSKDQHSGCLRDSHI